MSEPRYLTCITDAFHDGSIVKGRRYEVIDDVANDPQGFVRIVDGHGRRDCLYYAEHFQKTNPGHAYSAFWELVRQTNADCDETDAFDLDSNDAASCAKFKDLYAELHRSARALVEHVVRHREELERSLEETP